MGYIFVTDSIWVALQMFEQFCPKAGDANPLVAEPETDFNLKLVTFVVSRTVSEIGYGSLLVENRQFAPTPPSLNALARGDPLRILG